MKNLTSNRNRMTNGILGSNSSDQLDGNEPGGKGAESDSQTATSAMAMQNTVVNFTMLELRSARPGQQGEEARRRGGNHDHGMRLPRSVFRFIGVLQQESGKGPRLADGAAYCVPDLTSHTLPPWRALLGRPDP